MSAKHMPRSCVPKTVIPWLVILPLLCGQGHAGAQGGSPKILVDAVASDTRELKKDAESLNGGCGGGYRILEHPTTVGEFEGENVKSIRVIRFTNSQASLTKKQLQNELLKVWLGKFQTVYCYLPWDEVALWSIEAKIEFEDGKWSALITDGVHVALQDHDGKGWYFRLLPAAQ